MTAPTTSNGPAPGGREAGAWWQFGSTVPSPELRLVCFAHAGGGASAYRSWPALAPPGVEVCPVQLPGREARIAEPVPDALSDLVAQASDALMPLFDVPFVFFGASFGAILGFELAHHLRSVHGFGPSALAVAGEWAPTSSVRESRVPVASGETFLRQLRDEQILPSWVLDDPDLAGAVLPALRADTALSAQFRPRARERLDCPVYAVRGRHDPRVTAADMASWAEETTARHSYVEVESGHLVLEASPEVVARLAANLRTDGLL